jgi:hypothetical protein
MSRSSKLMLLFLLVKSLPNVIDTSHNVVGELLFLIPFMIILLKIINFIFFNVTFNNISAISWQSVLLKETAVPWENHRPVASHWQTLSRNVVSSTPRLSGIRTCNISEDRHWLHICSYKSNYYTITTTLSCSIWLS